MTNENNDIFSNIVVLDHFKESLIEKFDIVKDYYETLSIYFEKYPISHKTERNLSRYPLGEEFFKIFSLTSLNEDEINFALNTVYATIGIEDVVFQIAKFSGLKIKIDNLDTAKKKLTITIVSENIFDLNLFEVKFTDFLNDLLLFQNLDFIFDLIVTTVDLEYSKKVYNVMEFQNLIPLEIDKVLE